MILSNEILDINDKDDVLIVDENEMDCDAHQVIKKSYTMLVGEHDGKHFG